MDNEQGFVALISTIIITALLLILVVSLSTAAFALSSSGIEAADMVRARAVAQSCGRLTLLRLAADPKFTGNSTIYIYGHQCKVGAIDFSGDSLKFQTSVVVSHAVAGVEFLVNKDLLEIIQSFYIPVAQ